jgi:orotate phosphoribosyltransferase
MQDQVESLLPKRVGHFVYESGHHGEVWLELERLALWPERLRPLVDALAERLRPHAPEVVCAPLVEGAFVGLGVATALGVPFTYTSPARAAAGAGLFPVSYAIPLPLERELAGRRVAVVNDAINAGSAVRGTLADLRRVNARAVAIATLAVYGDSARALAAVHGAALEALASFPSLIFEPAACPLCAKGVPLSAAVGDGPLDPLARLATGPALVPELYVTELARSLRFYVDGIGFAVDYARPEDGFASLSLGRARLMLEETRSLFPAGAHDLARGEFRTAELRAPFGRGINLELRVPDVLAVSRRLAAAAHPVLLEPYEKSYRVGERMLAVRQLLVADPDGYLIRPSQVLEPSV